MKLTKNQRLLVLVAIILGGGLGIYLIGDYVGLWGIAPDSTTPSTDLTVSSFTFLSAQDGEDVSPFTEVDLWAPKSGATFEDGYADITDLTTNFERIETGKDADDVLRDLRGEPYYWLEITGNTVFDNTFYLLIGGTNYNYLYNIHDSTSDVNFAIMNSTMGSITIPGQATADNYTAELRAPHYTVAGSHYGDNWAMSTTDFAELSLREQEAYWNEMYWQDQFPTYNPSLDTSNEYDRNWEQLTNTFGLKWTFNNSINVTDGSLLEVNCTIDRGYPIEILISGANLYMIWDEGINFNPDYTFTFEMWFAANISVTTVESGRADIYGDLSTLTWAETYSTIGT